MNRDKQWNEDLHRRLRDGVAAGQISVVPEGDGPQVFAVERMTENLRQGRALLDGMTVYRGAKDPEVDAGTFGAKTKHATPTLAVARGYAEFSNEHIGLRCPATRGIGMLAEYALPDDAVFHRNFGLEAQQDPAKATPGLTRAEAEARLLPLVQAYAAATEPIARDEARQAVEAFCARELYELALPAACTPKRQFVVQYDESGRSRLLAHQDTGPLGDVLVDVVRARKAAVDEYHADKLLGELARGGRCGFDRLAALQPGLPQVYADVARQVMTVTSRLRDKDTRMPLTSVSEAIAWRRQAQRGIRMEQLTNSGIVIEHADPAITQIAALRPALDKIDAGVVAARWLGEREPALRQLRKASAAAAQQEAAVGELATTKAEFQRVEGELGKWQAARDRAAAQYRQVNATHTRQLQRNFIQRLWYRWRSQSAVEANLQRRAEAIRQLNARLKVATVASQQAMAARDAAVARRSAASETLASVHTGLSAMREAGTLDFLGDAARRIDKRELSAPVWAALAGEAEAGAKPLMESILQAQSVAGELAGVARTGFAPSALTPRTEEAIADFATTVPPPEPSAPSASMPAPQVARSTRRVARETELEMG